MSNTTRPLQKPLDEQEFKRLQQRLTDWSVHGHHHLHRSWQLPGCQEALHWHQQAQAWLPDTSQPRDSRDSKLRSMTVG